MRSLSEEQEQEQRFLEHIAADYLPAKNDAAKELFKEIFKHNQGSASDIKKFKDAKYKSYGGIRSNLTIIYESFKKQDQDCPLRDIRPGRGRTNKYPILHNWLWSEKYPLWVKSRSISPESIWQLLLSQANQTNGIKLLTGERQRDLGLGQQTVSLGSQIRLEIDLKSQGYLLLLDRGTSGKIVCLSPSLLIPPTRINSERILLPPETSPYKTIQVTGELGEEQLLAIVTRTQLNLDWLGQAHQTVLPLNDRDLEQLVNYLEQVDQWQAWYAQFTVTA